MTHAALTPLLGREFDDFLFASIDDRRDGLMLSVVSALAQLDVDPWQEAASLARMPRDQAKRRLTGLIASLPKGAATGASPEMVAARLTALLPQAGGVNTASAAPLRQIEPMRNPRLFVALGVLALLLAGYFIFNLYAYYSNGDIRGTPAATAEPADRR